MPQENHQLRTIETLLAWAGERLAAGSGSPRLDAEVLLCHALNTSRAALYANPAKPVSAREALLYDGLVSARSGGRPVAQLTGEREFWSLPLKITADVLVPRPETELLVERTLTHIRDDATCSILDLGTGSGAIAIALASECSCTLTATDVSTAALAVARDNAERLAPGRIRIVESNWFDALADESFDLIASNPPYIANGETDLTDRELAFEPTDALYSGEDGLDAIRAIVSASAAHLRPDGWLLLEHGLNQAAAVQQLMENAGFNSITSCKDIGGHDRVTEARTGPRKND